MAHEAEAWCTRQVLGFKRLPHEVGCNFGARVFGDVLNRARKLDLQTTWQIKAVLGFHNVSHATFARLAVDSDDCFVGAPHMLGVKRQVRHFPLLVVLCQCIETLFDCILMTARKCGVHQVAGVGLPFGYG